MKIIKDGKLFGKVNLLDATIVILLLALVVAGMFKFRTLNRTVDVAAAGKITYQIVINSVRDYTVNAFQSGDAVFDSQTGNRIGTIVKVESGDASIIRSLASGKVAVEENPFRKDVILTIETPGSSTDNGYYANRSIELKVGSEKSIETLYAASYGKIKSIAYTEE